MLLELAKPVTLLACVLSLLVVMHTAFFGPETDFDQRIYNSLVVLTISAGVSLLSGLVFLESARKAARASHRYLMRVMETFPMQVFFWTAGIMVAVFAVAWYLEKHCVFYRDVRY